MNDPFQALKTYYLATEQLKGARALWRRVSNGQFDEALGVSCNHPIYSALSNCSSCRARQLLRTDYVDAKASRNLARRAVLALGRAYATPTPAIPETT